jgi:hypothetical protein
LILAGTVLTVKIWPRPVWFVEEGFEKTWGEILRTASPPPPFSRILVYNREGGIPKGWGFIITRDLDLVEEAQGEGERAGPLAVIPHLYERGKYRGARVLAVDPWMMFRKNQDPRLTQLRTENPAGGAGNLILPGAEQDAVTAWLAQFLQNQPGVFPDKMETWDAAEEGLFRGRRFQTGALTYSWFDVWILLLKNDPAWVYAPLSRVRKELSEYQVGLLDAAPFPLRPDWNEYGLQADTLWALRWGSKKRSKKLMQADNWLGTSGIQTKIADMMGWIPAHAGGIPFDTIAREAQVAWFSSSFIWQGVNNCTGR